MVYYDGHLASHPWIDFKFDVRNLDYKCWVALGECVSKCEHIANTPLSPDVSRRLHFVYLSKGVHATTAIEGNTLSLKQVELAVENKLEVVESKQYQKQEVDNIISAYNTILSKIRDNSEERITPELLNEYNKMVLKDLALEPDVIAGHPRDYVVGVGRYRAPESQHVRELIGSLCKKLEEMNVNSVKGLSPIALAIIKAIFAHLYIAWIHPFGDGNGRTARLLEVDILLRAGVPAPACQLLSNHYNTTRPEYYRQLDLASSQRQHLSFISYAIIGFRDALIEQLEKINEYVRKAVWINYVHDEFGKEHTEVIRRRRDVVLALTETDGVEIGNVRILDKLPEYYTKRNQKTFERDINFLKSKNFILVEKDQDGKTICKANLSLVDVFLPHRKKKIAQ